MLSADAFAAFEEVGLDKEEDIQAIGARFRDTVLSLGGSQSPAEVFQAFRGRPASSEALIRHSGLQVISPESIPDGPPAALAVGRPGRSGPTGMGDQLLVGPDRHSTWRPCHGQNRRQPGHTIRSQRQK